MLSMSECDGSSESSMGEQGDLVPGIFQAGPDFFVTSPEGRNYFSKPLYYHTYAKFIFLHLGDPA